jgi:hypothetical protein
MHGVHGETVVRRIQGVLSLAKKYGVASVDDACPLNPKPGMSKSGALALFISRQLEPLRY